jgi:hypothetical protein
MKNKSGKGARPLLPSITVLDPRPRRDNTPGKRRSWLSDDTEEIRLSQARAAASEIFLQTRLLPLIERGQRLDEATLTDLLIEFKRSRGNQDVPFEMAQVTARVLSRFQCYWLDDLNGDPPSDADSLTREVDLLAALAPLDFQRIDEQVRERLQAG